MYMVVFCVFFIIVYANTVHKFGSFAHIASVAYSAFYLWKSKVENKSKFAQKWVAEMADKYGDKLKFTSLNTTKARRLAIGQQILGLPVMAIYKDGQKIEEVVKEDATQESIEAMIKKYI